MVGCFSTYRFVNPANTEFFRLLRYYAVLGGLKPTFREYRSHLQGSTCDTSDETDVQSWNVILNLKDWNSPETSVSNHFTSNLAFKDRTKRCFRNAGFKPPHAYLGLWRWDRWVVPKRRFQTTSGPPRSLQMGPISTSETPVSNPLTRR